MNDNKKFIFAAVTSSVLLFIVLMISGAAMRFHVGNNDFWGNFYLAQSANLKNPASFYNGFVPAGYTLVLHLFNLLSFDLVLAAFVLNAILASVLVYFIIRIMSQNMRLRWGIMTAGGVVFYPPFFRRMITPGPDLGVAVWSALALLLLLYAPEKQPRNDRRLFTVGMLFGIAALWRYHALVLAALAIILVVAYAKEFRLRTLTSLLGGFFAIVWIQIAANLAAGVVPFHTDQAFNVYKMVHGMEWSRVGASHGDLPAVFSLISQAPTKFISRWLTVFSEIVPLLIPVVLAGWFSINRIVAKSFLYLVPCLALYCLAVSLGDRGGGDALVHPWSVIGVALLAQAGFASACMKDGSLPSKVANVVIICGIVFLSLMLLKKDAYLVGAWRSDNSIYRQVQKIVLAHTDISLNSKQIYSTDFRLYFPDVEPRELYYNGGWLRYHSKYEQEFPNLSTASIGALIDDCRKRDIRFIVLTDRAGEVIPELADVYIGGEIPVGLSFVGETHGFKVFKINPSHD